MSSSPFDGPPGAEQEAPSLDVEHEEPAGDPVEHDGREDAAPEVERDIDGAVEPPTDTALQLAILDALRRAPGPLSKRAVITAVHAHDRRVSPALARLVEQGQIVQQPRGFALASSARSPAPRKAALHVVPIAEDDRPAITIGPELDQVVGRGVAALARDPNLYEQNGALVHVVRLEKDVLDQRKTRETDTPKIRIVAGTPQIRDLPLAVLRTRLTRCARWLRIDRRSGNMVQIIPPDDVVQAILLWGSWPGVRPLVGIIEAPALRPDGTVIDRPGYDDATGYIYAPSCEYPTIPEQPTLDDAQRALATLEDVFSDFPYEKPAGRSVAVAAVLTLIARPAILGATPATLFDASTPGSGKTLQADGAAIIATGRGAGRKGFPTDQRGANDELDKVLCSYALMGARLINFDNIGGKGVEFGGPALEAVLTAEDTAEFRKLGGNTMVVVPWRTLVMGSGNNISISRDMNRRVMLNRIESPYSKPELRPLSDFKHPDRAFRLKAWIKENRPRLVVAALTLLRAHAIAGRPGPNRTWGGFEAWTKVIADAIVWAGGADPLECRPTDEGDENPEKMSIGVVLRDWHRLDTDGKGITIKTLLGCLYPPERLRGEQLPPDGFDDMRTALELLVPTKPRQIPDATELGCVFRRYKGSNVGGLKLVPAKQERGIGRWTVTKVQKVVFDSAKAAEAAPRVEEHVEPDVEREAIQIPPCKRDGCACTPCIDCGRCRKLSNHAGGCSPCPRCSQCWITPPAQGGCCC
jgi:hypothetical protein